MNIDNRSQNERALLLALSLGLCCACGSKPSNEQQSAQWSAVMRDLPGALVSVWGTSSRDVWTVGADAGDGSGPTVLHYDGSSWERLSTGQSGDLLWVFGFREGPVFMGGEGGVILRYRDGAFERMSTPSTDAVFGIWGTSPNDVWAVGGAIGGARDAFAWHLSGDQWTAASPLPNQLSERGALWKVFGRSSTDAWFVGTNGSILRWTGNGFDEQRAPISESLFTVHANSHLFAAVGGFGTGLLLENDGGSWRDASPKAASPLIGVCLTESGGYAVGQFGAVYSRGATGWSAEDTGQALDESLHSVWVDPDGGVWAVGGNVLTKPLVSGVMLHKGKAVPRRYP